MNLLFVYGTLKRGGANHAFLRGQHYVGPARTAPGYVLYSLGDYPGMVRAAGDATGVSGELWSVDDSCLGELDELEGLAEGLYERIDVLLASSAGAGSAQTYLYLRSVDGLQPVGDTWPVGPAT